MRKIVLALGITTGLGISALTQAQQTGSAIQESFDRDIYRQDTVTAPVVLAPPTPLQALFAKKLAAQSDPVRTAFQRDLHHQPVSAYAAAGRGEHDPLAEAIQTALWGNLDPVLASFARDLYRVPTPGAVTLADRADSVQILFDKMLQQQYTGTPILARSGPSPLEKSVTN